MDLLRSWSVQSGLKRTMCLLALSRSGRKEDDGLFGSFLSSFLIAHEIILWFCDSMIGKDFATKQDHQILGSIALSKTHWNHWLQEALDPTHRAGKANISVGLRQRFQHGGWRKGRRDGIIICFYGCFSLFMKNLSHLILPVLLLSVSSCSSPPSSQPVRSPGTRLSHTQPTSRTTLPFLIFSVGFFQLSSFTFAEWVFILFFSLLDAVSSLTVRDKLEWLPVV